MVSRTVILAALASTGLISLAPNLLLILFPKYASGEGNRSSVALTLGQALAAGGLLGDVFLHTIPHTAAEGGHESGLWILLGFSVFLVADMLLRSMGSSPSHSHSHKKKEKVEEDHPHNFKNTTEMTSISSKFSTILLNLAADAMHNFTDGLAIGASFSVSAHRDPNASFTSLLKSRGGLATISILMHEIPHELGDFAILVKNGMSKRQAIAAQFGTAIAAMLGTVTGLLLQDFAGDSLMLVTAGGFVYLAACNILPEILHEESSSLRFRMAQIGAFAVGIGFLYGVSLLEELEDGHGHGHNHGHNHGHGHSIDHAHESSHSHGHDHGHHEHHAHDH